MNIQVIQVPYDSGHADVRTGRGPACLVDHGLDRVLREMGHTVDVGIVRSGLPLPTEIGTFLDVNRLLADQVRSAVGSHGFPLILAGNCNSCVGALAGLATEPLGIVWFDAHGDFNTPETTTTGFLDGMGLAMATGRCWKALLRTLDGFVPVADDCIVHIGARDLDPGERSLLDHSDVSLITADPQDETAFLSRLDRTLAGLKTRVERIYLHIDVDVLTTALGVPNHLSVPGGLSPRLVEKSIASIRGCFDIAAFTLASFDPVFDEGNCVLDAGIGLIKAVVAD